MKYDKKQQEIKNILAFLIQNRKMIYIHGHFSLLYLQSALWLEDLISRENKISPKMVLACYSPAVPAVSVGAGISSKPGWFWMWLIDKGTNTFSFTVASQSSVPGTQATNGKALCLVL